jgi:hypothetical protein
MSAQMHCLTDLDNQLCTVSIDGIESGCSVVATKSFDLVVSSIRYRCMVNGRPRQGQDGKFVISVNGVPYCKGRLPETPDDMGVVIVRAGPHSVRFSYRYCPVRSYTHMGPIIEIHRVAVERVSWADVVAGQYGMARMIGQI